MKISAEYPTPKLLCPPNSIAELPPYSEEVEVKVPRPKTDLNIKRDVTMKPLWIRNDRVVLKRGELNVTYTARHPISKLTTSCTTTIYVVGEYRERVSQLVSLLTFNSPLPPLPSTFSFLPRRWRTTVG
jgi:hypothetical protein